VNDLDLVVEKSTNTYKGNVFGTNGWSATGGSADFKNNLEGVFLAPPSGAVSLTVKVVAAAINWSCQPPPAPTVMNQGFALVCYNGAPDCNGNGIDDAVDEPLVGVSMGYSSYAHGSFPDVRLQIPGDASFSEPRRYDSATNPERTISKLLVGFTGPIDSNVGPSNVHLAGNDQFGQPMNLSSITIATTWDPTPANELVITFTPALPHFARYRVTLTGIRDPTCIPLQGNLERIMTGLVGDAKGDLLINSMDVGGIRSLIGVTFDPIIVLHIRSDVDHDGVINSTDKEIAAANLNDDARYIPNP
jgi:hypothetical protein